MLSIIGDAWLGKYNHSPILKCKVLPRPPIQKYFKMLYTYYGASFIAQLVNNLPAMKETWVQFLGHEDPLEKDMATHSSILAWKIPWTVGPNGL